LAVKFSENRAAASAAKITKLVFGFIIETLKSVWVEGKVCDKSFGSANTDLIPAQLVSRILSAMNRVGALFGRPRSREWPDHPFNFSEKTPRFQKASLTSR
jgi:hypothetical protein